MFPNFRTTSDIPLYQGRFYLTSGIYDLRYLRNFRHDFDYLTRSHLLVQQSGTSAGQVLTRIYGEQCSTVSLSWFCDHRACISLAGRIGTDTGCAGCGRVERTDSCEEHTHICAQRPTVVYRDARSHTSARAMACKRTRVVQRLAAQFRCQQQAINRLLRLGRTTTRSFVPMLSILIAY